MNTCSTTFVGLALLVAAGTGCERADATVDQAATNLPSSTVWRAVASPDGDHLLYAHSGSVVGLWKTRTATTTWLEPRLDSSMFLDFAGSGPRIAVVGGHQPAPDPFTERAVRLLHFDMETGEVTCRADLPPGTIDILCANEDWIVAGRSQDDVDVWRRADNQWKNVWKLSTPSEGVAILACQFIDRDKLVVGRRRASETDAVGNGGDRLAVVDLAGKRILRETSLRLKAAKPIAVAQGATFVAVADDEVCEVYDLSDMSLHGRCDIRSVVEDWPVVSVSPDGKFVAYASASLEVRNLATGEVVLRDKLHQHAIQRLRKKDSGGSDQQVTQAVIWMIVNRCAEHVKFVADGSKLLVVTRFGLVRGWDTADWSRVENYLLTDAEPNKRTPSK